MQSVTKNKLHQSHVQLKNQQSVQHVLSDHSVQIHVQRSLLRNAKFANQHHVQLAQNVRSELSVQQLVQSLRRHTRRQNVQSVQRSSAKIHVLHLKRILIPVQQNAVTR